MAPPGNQAANREHKHHPAARGGSRLLDQYLVDDSLLALEEFTGLSLGSWEEDLDIARMNLMSARGLPGTENADIDAMLDRIDEMAAPVRWNIARHLTASIRGP